MNEGLFVLILHSVISLPCNYLHSYTILWCAVLIKVSVTSCSYSREFFSIFSDCTHNGDVFYAGQTFYDGCNTW